jgi:hypothetical protein
VRSIAVATSNDQSPALCKSIGVTGIQCKPSKPASPHVCLCWFRGPSPSVPWACSCSLPGRSLGFFRRRQTPTAMIRPKGSPLNARRMLLWTHAFVDALRLQPMPNCPATKVTFSTTVFSRRSLMTDICHEWCRRFFDSAEHRPGPQAGAWSVSDIDLVGWSNPGCNRFSLASFWCLLVLSLPLSTGTGHLFWNRSHSATQRLPPTVLKLV